MANRKASRQKQASNLWKSKEASEKSELGRRK